MYDRLRTQTNRACPMHIVFAVDIPVQCESKRVP